MRLYTLDHDPRHIGPINVGSDPDVAEQAVLNARGTAKMLSGPTTTIGFDVICEGRRGRLLGVETETLLSEPMFNPIPVNLPEQPDLEGYYSGSSVVRDVQLSLEDDDDHHALPLTLARVGTQGSHMRQIETKPYQVDHEFGNDTTALVAVPTVARKVQWFDDETSDRDPASPLETRQTAFGGVDIYDLTDAPWYAPPPWDEGPPSIIYDIDFDDDGGADCRVFDTRESSDKSEWIQIFTVQRDFVGELVIDTGLLRLRFDEVAGTIAAEEWDLSSESWTAVGLTQPSGVSLFDVDLTEVAMVRDRAQLTFDVDGSLFSLDAILSRGADAVLFTIPNGEDGPIPTAIEDWVGPIASTTLIDPNASKGLVSRTEVNK